MRGKVGRASLPASAAPFSSRRSGDSKPTGHGWAWTVTDLYGLNSREILATLNHDQRRAPLRNPVPDYPGTDANKIAHYTLRWMNRRGEKGPWFKTAGATIGG